MYTKIEMNYPVIEVQVIVTFILCTDILYPLIVMVNFGVLITIEIYEDGNKRIKNNEQQLYEIWDQIHEVVLFNENDVVAQDYRVEHVVPFSKIIKINAKGVTIIPIMVVHLENFKIHIIYTDVVVFHDPNLHSVVDVLDAILGIVGNPFVDEVVVKEI